MVFLDMVVRSSIFILFILIVRLLFFNNIAKKKIFIMWIAACFRAIFPFSIPLFFKIDLSEQHLNSILMEGTGNKFYISHYVILLWGIGVVCLFCFVVTVNLLFFNKISESLPFDSKHVQQWKKKQKIFRTLHVRISDQIKVPISCGIIKPVIVLPQYCQKYNEEELTFVLEHELIHVKRFDSFKKGLFILALILQWFNPIIWIMYEIANRDMEMSCDEYVISKMGEEKKENYAKLLLRVSCTSNNIWMLSNGFNYRYVVVDRINAIFNVKKSIQKEIGITVLFVLIFVLLFIKPIILYQSFSDSIENAILTQGSLR